MGSGIALLRRLACFPFEKQNHDVLSLTFLQREQSFSLCKTHTHTHTELFIINNKMICQNRLENYFLLLLSKNNIQI